MGRHLQSRNSPPNRSPSAAPFKPIRARQKVIAIQACSRYLLCFILSRDGERLPLQRRTGAQTIIRRHGNARPIAISRSFLLPSTYSPVLTNPFSNDLRQISPSSLPSRRFEAERMALVDKTTDLHCPPTALLMISITTSSMQLKSMPVTRACLYYRQDGGQPADYTHRAMDRFSQEVMWQIEVNHGIPRNRNFIDDIMAGEVPNGGHTKEQRKRTPGSYQISRSRMQQPSFRLFVV
ncbi:hypothetical protein ALC57_10333 [Trachymyrmex cornetzi]|uniref:Uncharacterized protein n=1 Tax=Trachymyrmex cornetzi TaxID=471704 RepID=A0A195DXB4_9HYME|nr:hypothetical protein ALC57_10333 [Trachymyrmex cornetzi]